MSVADRVYARALYDAALERGNVKDVQAQLAAVAETMAELPQLRSVIGNPQVDPGSKAAVLEAAVENPDELVSNFLRLVAEKGRAGSIEGIRAAFDEIVARAEGQLTVTLDDGVRVDRAGGEGHRGARSSRPPAARSTPCRRSTPT